MLEIGEECLSRINDCCAGDVLLCRKIGAQRKGRIHCGAELLQFFDLLLNDSGGIFATAWGCKPNCPVFYLLSVFIVDLRLFERAFNIAVFRRSGFLEFIEVINIRFRRNEAFLQIDALACHIIPCIRGYVLVDFQIDQKDPDRERHLENDQCNLPESERA